MAGRRQYSEDDKAKVYVVLAANDGNVKRTARETGVPENTVRRWRNEFQEAPPRTELVEQAMGDFVEEAESVRNLALARIKDLIPTSTRINELNTTVGILTDKIDRARGLGETRTVKHEHELTSSDELKALMGGFVKEMRARASEREEEIQDAEIVEQAALPAGQ